jgi:hypothetical protein
MGMDDETVLAVACIFCLLVFMFGAGAVVWHHANQIHQEVVTCQQQGRPLAECRKAVE